MAITKMQGHRRTKEKIIARYGKWHIMEVPSLEIGKTKAYGLYDKKGHYYDTFYDRKTAVEKAKEYASLDKRTPLQVRQDYYLESGDVPW